MAQQVLEHAKTVEALNQSEAERGAVEQKVADALREAADAKSALVWPAPFSLLIPPLHMPGNQLCEDG